MSTKKQEKVKDALKEQADRILKQVSERLDSIEKTYKAVSSHLVRKVEYHISADLYNIHLTLEAMQQVLADAAGLTVEAYKEKLHEKKKILHSKNEEAGKEEIKALSEKEAK